MTKRRIQVTGNDDIDQAAAEIAVALRDGGRRESEAYEEAERLRNAIMDGTRVLDTHGIENCKGCDERIHPGNRRWAIVWDGEKWCMVGWVVTMPLGPYHGGPCISEELNKRNAPGFEAMP